MGKSQKITKFGLTLTPLPTQIFSGAPKISKLVLGVSFQGILLGIVWTTSADLGSQRWEFGTPDSNGGHPQYFGPNL